MSRPDKFEKFLKKYKCEKGQPFTHTRIGDNSLGVFPGSYFIPNDKTVEFYNLYVEKVFVNGKQEYLTEKQPERGPLLIDIDFRYGVDIDERQHGEDDIINFIEVLLEKIKKIYNVDSKSKINIYVFEKNNVNCLDEVTKDGIHIMTDISMDVICKTLIRNMLLEELPKIWNHLPIINTWSDVLDIAVIRGDNNWQMVGSRKPGNEAYELKKYYQSKFINNNDGWDFKEINEDFDYKENFYALSCRSMEMNAFDFNPSIKPQYDNLFNAKKNKSFVKKINKSKNVKTLGEIDNEEELDELIENMLSSCNNNNVSDVHKYTMVLPESFYGPGSYNNWIRVGWALKNTNEKLVLTWIKFSLQSSSTDFNDMFDLIDKWESFDKYNSDCLTGKSIRFWAKQNNPEEYEKIRKKTIDYFIESTFKHNQEFDIANVLYELYKDKYVCISPKDNIWYEFIDNRWVPSEAGTTLRLKISRVLSELYGEKVDELDKKIYNIKNNENLINQASNISNMMVDKEKDEGNPIINQLKAKRDIFNEIYIKKLRSTTWKNNIMKEAKDIFYDKEFISKMNRNEYLLCFNNCVIDFKTNEVRNGRPDDYITKSTNTNFLKDNEIDQDKYNKIKDEIYLFMEQLFPNPNLRKYMWEHLASILLGTTEQQTFNIFLGSGANGKSILMELISKMLGEYKGTVPISLITQKRNSIGGTSSEIAALIGVRYAVMQEPSKGDEVNDGVLKELTGSDPIQCRQLFRESQTFIPQFKLVVCTNVLFDIKSQDDGTWRRIRLVDFESKFTDNPNTKENPNNNKKFSLDVYPYQFKIDRRIHEKFTEWAPVFMKELVKLAMKTKGKVEDCPEVMESTDKYRQDKDIFSEFDSENIIEEEGNNVTKTNLRETFKQFYEDKYDKNKIPQGKELYDWFDKKYGKCKPGKGWINIALTSTVNMN